MFSIPRIPNWTQKNNYDSDVAAVPHVARGRADGQVMAGLRDHSIVGFDGCLHPVDEVGLLEEVARDVQAHALVELQWLCRLVMN